MSQCSFLLSEFTRDSELPRLGVTGLGSCCDGRQGGIGRCENQKTSNWFCQLGDQLAHDPYRFGLHTRTPPPAILAKIA